MTDWAAIGRRVRRQIPSWEYDHFVQWLTDNDLELRVFERAPGEAIRRWHDSLAWYKLHNPTEVEEGL